tara:strand:- start:26 stop:712 length:687 start_codon:yes stop_codon:yes gene_type:complete
VALIYCSSCGKSISDKAEKCPHCMAVIDRRPKIKCAECRREITIEYKFTREHDQAYKEMLDLFLKDEKNFKKNYKNKLPIEKFYEALPCKYCGCPQPPPQIIICGNPNCGHPNPFYKIEKKDLFCSSCEAPIAFENTPEKEQIKIKKTFYEKKAKEEKEYWDDYKRRDNKTKLQLVIIGIICFGIGLLRMGTSNNGLDFIYQRQNNLDRMIEKSIPQRQQIDLNIYER